MSDTRSDSPPAIPPAALEAINAPRAPDAPRRCFICLTDQSPFDPPNSWVDPCPCTLEAHHDCMLSWVVDCERSGKPLRCPVCKSTIALEGPWDPVVALSDAIQRRFTRASPFMLFSGVTLGIQASSQMYGALAMWVFAGKESLVSFLGLPVDGYSPPANRFVRVGNSIILMHIAPTLLLGQLLPSLGNKIFVPAASAYGIYHFLHDDQFVSWPPSPQLAVSVFPYIRSLYHNFWYEFVHPYELSLNRQILGLPPVDPRQNNNGNGNNRNRANRRNEDREAGGVIGFLQSLLDALDPDDEQGGGGRGGIQIQQGRVDDNNGGDQEGGAGVMIDVELVIEEDRGDAEEDEGGSGDEEEAEVEVELGELQPDQVDEVLPDLLDEAAPAPVVPVALPAQDENQDGEDDHEVPQAPPANRAGLGTILSNMSNALVSALILPGVSFAVGEVLRRTLPASWTGSAGGFSRFGRDGLLQKQWGRSLIGGCLYVVIKDAVRVYAKQRKVTAMNNRRVKNVDRPRRSANASQ